MLICSALNTTECFCGSLFRIKDKKSLDQYKGRNLTFIRFKIRKKKYWKISIENFSKAMKLCFQWNY